MFCFWFRDYLVPGIFFDTFVLCSGSMIRTIDILCPESACVLSRSLLPQASRGVKLVLTYEAHDTHPPRDWCLRSAKPKSALKCYSGVLSEVQRHPYASGKNTALIVIKP